MGLRARISVRGPGCALALRPHRPLRDPLVARARLERLGALPHLPSSRRAPPARIPATRLMTFIFTRSRQEWASSESAPCPSCTMEGIEGDGSIPVQQDDEQVRTRLRHQTEGAVVQRGVGGEGRDDITRARGGPVYPGMVVAASGQTGPLAHARRPIIPKPQSRSLPRIADSTTTPRFALRDGQRAGSRQDSPSRELVAMINHLDENRHSARRNAIDPRCGVTRRSNISATDPGRQPEPSWTRFLGLEFGADSTPDEPPDPPTRDDYEVAKRIGYVALLGILTVIGAMVLAYWCFSHP